MDPRSAERLEFPVVRGRLADRTSFQGGRDLATAVAPSPDPEIVAALQAETDEAVALREAGFGGPVGAHDVRELVGTAARGEVASAEGLESVAATCAVASEICADMDGHVEDAPLLAGLVAEIAREPLASLGARLAESLDGHGGLKDEATPELARVRSSLRAARREASESLRRLADRLSSHLSEEFVTERSGRSVLAVRASSRSSVPGIVHGTSGSGQTLFVEPLETVELGNRVRELESAESVEVERILWMLTERVAGLGSELEVAVGALSTLDLALARAALSVSWSGCRVKASSSPRLLGARHPLLDPATAVPIDIDMSGVSVLVVSGPNAGGKTVALKTLGLAASLHQCGLRPPAREASLPVYRRILAEIGDDQSIELSLSTFSARVRQLASMLDAAGPGVLVLLDEIAAGTDPVEGAALAQAILAALADRGASALATTHHPDVKEWAAASPRAANAAVGVDPRTFEPRYELLVGEPGASHALEIAERLGIDAGVVASAREALDPTRRSAERLLAEAARARAVADDERARAREEAERAQEARRAAETAERRWEKQREELRAGAERERERARAAAKQELADLEAELATLRAAIADARREERARGEGAPTQAAERSRARDRQLGEASSARRRARAALAQEPAAEGRVAEVGDHVADVAMGFRGEVVAVRGGQAEVRGPGARVRVPLERLEVVGAPRPAEEPPDATRAPPPLAAAIELDIRGERAEPARSMVRAAVDRAGAAGSPEVTVIHGHGTGALRTVVREELASHPMVTRAEPAPPHRGGDGATVAYLD